LHNYSTVVVIDSLLKTEEIDNTIDKVGRSIKNNGGDIIEVNRWGKKRLAYEIKKRQYGYYVEIIFKAQGDVIKIMERDFTLDENVLRFLTTQMDKNEWEYILKEREDSMKKKKEIVSLDEPVDVNFKTPKPVNENATEYEEELV